MPPRRRHGLIDHAGRVALNAYQLAGATVWACEVLGFYFLFAPSVDDAGARVGAMIAYGALAATATVAFFAAAATDPKARVAGGEDDDAKEKIEAWRVDYNEQRPHSALCNLAPKDFASSGRASPAR